MRIGNPMRTLRFEAGQDSSQCLSLDLTSSSFDFVVARTESRAQKHRIIKFVLWEQLLFHTQFLRNTNMFVSFYSVCVLSFDFDSPNVIIVDNIFHF